MHFEWDYHKAEHNLNKHRIDFADAASVFEDLNAITLDDVHDEEQRFISIGIYSLSRILVVAYTWRGEIIRIISARKATKRERKQYEEGI